MATTVSKPADIFATNVHSIADAQVFRSVSFILIENKWLNQTISISPLSAFCLFVHRSLVSFWTQKNYFQSKREKNSERNVKMKRSHSLCTRSAHRLSRNMQTRNMSKFSLDLKHERQFGECHRMMKSYLSSCDFK